MRKGFIKWLILVSLLLTPYSLCAQHPGKIRLWNHKDLATWAVPIAGVKATPNFYTEEEYYAAPVQNLRTYPVYHPDYEPKGYRARLKKLGPQPLVEPEKLQTEQDWIEAGRRVFDELDVPLVCTSSAKAFKYLRDRQALKRDGVAMNKDGELLGLRWVVEKRGELKLGLSECSACHTRLMEDGTILRGAPSNIKFNPKSTAFAALLSNFVFRDDADKPIPPGQASYMLFGVPWLPDDVHLKFKAMEGREVAAVNAFFPGTFARFNGSPYYTTKMIDLIGVKDRRYLNHTGTHLNRGPEDIARYGILVSTADDGSIGPFRFLGEKQRRLLSRFPDEAMLALGKFIYSLQPPPNPNKFDATAARGQQIFRAEGCAECHQPPLYTDNSLMPVKGFKPDPADVRTRQLHISSRAIDTDPGVALKTRKGTGYYRVPSLRGLWYRGLMEHSGSIATLEEWFDRRRLRDDFVPSGWKGPGVTKRAVAGHEYGMDLSEEDKKALIAFLKTL